MRDFLTSPEINGKLDAFITLHTYSQMWIHPYSHERKRVPADIAELVRVGEGVTDLNVFISATSRKSCCSCVGEHFWN